MGRGRPPLPVRDRGGAGAAGAASLWGGEGPHFTPALDAAGPPWGALGGPPKITGGVPGVPMEVGGGRRLRILEDLNMLYIRQIAASIQEPELQRALERALRVREGARRLLPACSRPEQALETTKTLVLCDARVVAAGGELQRRQEARLRGARRPSDGGPGAERVPCRGTVCISDLRIPLMWKDTEYFRNKGELHRCAVFLLLQVGAEIHDTPTVLVDRTLTDICFEGAVLFSEAGPDFELKVELYSAGLPGGGAQGSTPKKLATRLSTSLGRSSGRRARAAMEGGPGSPPGTGGTGALLLPPPGVPCPRFQLLAHATLSLAQVHDGFRTHDLVIAADEQSPCWVPLYGRMCCRLAARPSCMDTAAATGTLRLQAPGAEGPSGPPLFCVLRGPGLLCYGSAGEAEAGQEPTLTIAVTKDTRVRAAEPGGRGQPPGVAVTNRLGGEEVTHVLVAESAAEAQRWLEAFGQHLHDLAQWKQCCEELMRIEEPPPRRPPAPLPPQGSLYHQTAIDPSDDIAAVTDILARHRGAPRAPGPPPWLSLFEGPPLRSPSPPRRGRPRTLSLDARLSTLKGRGGPPKPPHSSSSSSGSSSPGPPQRDPPRALQSRV
ncbi:LOW QUALITY PROTEIN: rhotekin [Prinia subflava]|uniref:LOW QUALITY PROTEIN: rhotekin n=1 Tax=Prinia subflava TaxID=208062 RepID=UPI002FE36DE7